MTGLLPLIHFFIRRIHSNHSNEDTIIFFMPDVCSLQKPHTTHGTFNPIEQLIHTHHCLFFPCCLDLLPYKSHFNILLLCNATFIVLCASMPTITGNDPSNGNGNASWLHSILISAGGSDSKHDTSIKSSHQEYLFYVA